MGREGERDERIEEDEKGKIRKEGKERDGKKEEQ